MFLVGLTGGIGTGKSTASNMFKALGVPVIDADQIAREVVQPERPAWRKIRQQFGAEVFLSDGQLDRAEMARQIFSSESKRRCLNAITHPEIRKAIFWQIMFYFIKGYQFVVLDLPLLFESRNMVSFLSCIVVVSCTEGQQLQRLMVRSSYSREEAESRINAQMPLTEKCRMATYIIDNSGTPEMMEKQILNVYNTLKRSRVHWPLRIIGWTSLAVMVWICIKIISAVL